MIRISLGRRQKGWSVCRIRVRQKRSLDWQVAD